MLGWLHPLPIWGGGWPLQLWGPGHHPPRGGQLGGRCPEVRLHSGGVGSNCGQRHGVAHPGEGGGCESGETEGQGGTGSVNPLPFFVGAKHQKCFPTQNTTNDARRGHPRDPRQGAPRPSTQNAKRAVENPGPGHTRLQDQLAHRKNSAFCFANEPSYP